MQTDAARAVQWGRGTGHAHSKKQIHITNFPHFSCSSDARSVESGRTMNVVDKCLFFMIKFSSSQHKLLRLRWRNAREHRSERAMWLIKLNKIKFLWIKFSCCCALYSRRWGLRSVGGQKGGLTEALVTSERASPNWFSSAVAQHRDWFN